MKLTPLRDRVLIEKDEPIDKTAGGIIIPDLVQDAPMTGTVISVGPGRRSPRGYWLPTSVEPGSKAVFKRYDGSNPTIRGEKFFLIREEDILALL